MSEREDVIARAMTTLLGMIEQSRPMQDLHISLISCVSEENILVWVEQMYLYEVKGEEYHLRLEELEENPISIKEVDTIISHTMVREFRSKILSG